MADVIEIGRFLGIKAAYGPAFLTDGRLAFVSNIAGVPQVFAVPGTQAPNGACWWPEQITFFQDRIGAAYPSPTASELIIAGDHLGDERFQLQLISSHGETVTPITTAPDVMY